MRRKRKLGIFVLLILVIASEAFYYYDSQFQDTQEERTAYIQQQRPSVVIVSETFVDGGVICELAENGRVGYAVFERQDNQRLRWRYTLFPQTDMYYGWNIINGHDYGIFLCRKPERDSLEVIYDNDDGTKDIFRADNLQDKTMVVQENMEIKNSRIFVTWYDAAGNEIAE